MIDTVSSRNNVPIRLTDERWAHIAEEHAELSGLREFVLETVADPARILQGTAGELLALRMLEQDKAMVVVYRETDAADGFIITAFVTRRLASLDRRPRVWPPSK